MTSVKPTIESTKTKPEMASKPEKMQTTQLKVINQRSPSLSGGHYRVLHDTFLFLCAFFATLGLLLFALHARTDWKAAEDDSIIRHTLEFYDSNLALGNWIVFQDLNGLKWRVKVERVDQSELIIPSVDTVYQVLLTFLSNNKKKEEVEKAPEGKGEEVMSPRQRNQLYWQYWQRSSRPLFGSSDQVQKLSAWEQILKDAEYSSTEGPKGEVKGEVEEVIVGDDSNLDMKKF